MDFGNKTYAETLDELGSLVLFKIPREKRPRDAKRECNVEAMKDYFKRLSLKFNDLSVIHIAGTKGKGSTCHFCESLLRNDGFKTGLFTSPHLVDVRERIKINGKPVKKDIFIQSFWKVHSKLESTKNEKFPTIATYFRVLTCMAVDIFLKENVDVAIFEVGLGGLNDATNFFSKPSVCGLSAIGIDHVELLGNTVTEIADKKAGIIKPGVACVTYDQPEGVIEVFESKAKENGSFLFLAKKFEEIVSGSEEKVDLKHMLGEHQKLNASLAFSIVELWKIVRNGEYQKIVDSELSKQNKTLFEADGVIIPKNSKLSNQDIIGFNECRVEGRGHVIKFRKKKLEFFLDGAHTFRSLEIVSKLFHQFCSVSSKYNGWIIEDEDSELMNEEFKNLFVEESKKHRNYEMKENCKILVFNFTGERNPENLLLPFFNLKRELHFDYVFFVSKDSSKESLRREKKHEKNKKEILQLEKCVECWKRNMKDIESIDKLQKVGYFESINQLLGWMWNKDEISTGFVLVTGSLYLVGDMLRKLGKIWRIESNEI